MDGTEKLKNKLLAKKKESPIVGLSTGSTLLNLACSGNPEYGYRAGGYYFFVGDSSSGKSFFSWYCFAEACRNKDFNDYKLVFNNAENGSLMSIEKFFGKKAKERVQVMKSPHLDHFYSHLGGMLKNEEKVIYILDSMDALKPKSDLDYTEKKQKADEKGKEAAGNYGTAKAKLNSQNMPSINSGLEKTGSILLVISQTRDNLGFGAMFNPKTRSGGTSLKFYAQLEIWTSIKEHLTKTATGRGKVLETGIVSKIHVKKNRLTGKDRKVFVPVYHSCGLDDTGSMVSYLCEWKHWNKEKGGTIQATEFDFSGPEEKLIKKIEEEDQATKLKEITTKVWNEVEESVVVERKARYD